MDCQFENALHSMSAICFFCFSTMCNAPDPEERGRVWQNSWHERGFIVLAAGLQIEIVLYINIVEQPFLYCVRLVVPHTKCITYVGISQKISNFVCQIGYIAVWICNKCKIWWRPPWECQSVRFQDTKTVFVSIADWMLRISWKLVFCLKIGSTNWKMIR